MAAHQFPSFRRRSAPLALSGIVAVALCALPALAADFPEPGPYGPPRYIQGERRPPPPPPIEDFGPERGSVRPVEPCRTVIRRRMSLDGEEIVKRVTICEERGRRPDRLGFEPPRRFLPPRDIPPSYGTDLRSQERGYREEQPSDEDDAAGELPPAGRGPDPRY